jgi:CheY-like chemotaxis protein
VSEDRDVQRTHKPVRVLVVEDDVDTLVVFGKALTAFGVDGIPVTTCADARAAVARLGGVDIVIADLELPDGDGVELARGLCRTYGCTAAIMSGHPRPDGTLPEGIDLWVQKPVGLPRLRETIDALTSAP